MARRVNYWIQTDQKQLASVGNSQMQASKGIVLDNLLVNGIISSGVDDSGPPGHAVFQPFHTESIVPTSRNSDIANDA